MRNVVKDDWKTFILYNSPIVLMGYARIMKGCHNFIQVISGYLLGYGIAKILYIYEDNIRDSFTSLKTKKKTTFK